MQRCFQCQKEIALKEAPAFTDQCPYCQTVLHCCFNCKYFSPTRSQQCAAPAAGWVKDKKNGNQCPEFLFREYIRQTTETEAERAQKKIDDLFRGL